MPLARTVSVLLLVATVAVSQQTGDANRNYLINGVGNNQPSYVTSTVNVIAPMVNLYNTQDPNMPVLWSYSIGGLFGWYLTPTNSVDVGTSPVDLLTLGTGFDPAHPWFQFMQTDVVGNLNFTLPAISSSAVGATLYLAMAHSSPTSPDGFYVSQTHQTTFIQDPTLGPSTPACTPGGTLQSLPDDGSVNVVFNFNFSFYNVTYTDLWIGSNGFITFGGGDSDFTETVPEFLNNNPRIALWWDDLNPANGTQGTISFFTDNASIAEVCFVGVPEFSNVGANDFKATLTSGGFFMIDYGPMSSQDAIVGVSPGMGLDPVGLSANLSQAPVIIPPGMACYEQFMGANTNDLSGYQVNVLQDGVGNPITIL